MDPGALPQEGMGLPLAVTFAGDGWSAREKRLVIRFLRGAGSEAEEAAGGSAAGPGGQRYSLRYSLNVGGEQSAPAARSNESAPAARSIHWRVTGPSGDGSVWEGTVTPSGTARRQAARLVQIVLEELYAVH
jgi:hypothetical protein